MTSIGQCLTIQLGPRSNKLAMYFWNGVKHLDYNPRLEYIWPNKGICSPPVVIFDEHLGSTLEQGPTFSLDKAEILARLPFDHWLRLCDAPFDFNNYHQIRSDYNIEEDLEESVRLLSERSDRVDSFQLLTDSFGLYLKPSINALELLSDFYPKSSKITVSSFPPNAVDAFEESIFITNCSEHSALFISNMSSLNFVAAAIDSLNVGGFKWNINNGIYSLEFNKEIMYSELGFDNKSLLCAITRGKVSLAEPPSKVSYHISQPSFAVNFSNNRWNYGQDFNSESLLNYKSEGIRDYIAYKFLNNIAFKKSFTDSSETEPGQFCQISDSLNRIIEGI